MEEIHFFVWKAKNGHWKFCQDKPFLGAAITAPGDTDFSDATDYNKSYVYEEL